MSKYIIEDSSLTAIADKIREKKYKSNQMTPAEMVEELDELQYGASTIDVDASITVEPWVRPAEYPDPTVIDLTDFDGVYLTYDLRKTPGYGWIGVWVDLLVSGQKAYIERGHIESSNFVVDERFEAADSEYFRRNLNEENGEVQLWRVRSDWHIGRIAFITNTDTAAQNFINTLQPVVERYGRLPYATNLSSTADSTFPTAGAWGTRFLERDDVKDITEVTNMASAYQQCYNLKELHMDGWNTSKVTSFAYCFMDCWHLGYIPFDKIQTDSATTFYDMMSNCRALDNVNISHFNIDKVTTMVGMFASCHSLEHLEMSELRGIGKLTSLGSFMIECRSLEDVSRNVKNLNVSNVTSLNTAFASCDSLKELDLSSWDVNKVTSLASMCDYDRNLEVLNVSGWDVSAVTTVASMCRECMALRRIDGIEDWELTSITNISSVFSYCYCLERFKIKRWDISRLTTAASAFNYCKSLKEIELSGWNVPNVLTTVASMFSYCQSLKKLHLPDMDFTVAVLLNDFVSECHSLEDLDLSNWHVAHILSFNAFFSRCYRLHEIDLTSWIVDSGEMSATRTLNNTFAHMRNCESIKISFPLKLPERVSTTTMFSNNVPLKYLDLRNWDISTSTNIYSPNTPTLEEYYPPKLPSLNQNYEDAKSLTPESLVRILEALPTVTTAKTITLGQANKLKLTDEKIAIATDKGWKVA